MRQSLIVRLKAVAMNLQLVAQIAKIHVLQPQLSALLLQGGQGFHEGGLVPSQFIAFRLGGLKRKNSNLFEGIEDLDR